VGDLRPLAVTSVATAAANIALTVALAPAWGLWGVLAGTVVALSLGSAAQVVVVQRRFKIHQSVFIHALRPIVPCCIVLITPIAAVATSGVLTSRYEAAGAVLIGGVAYFGLYAFWASRRDLLPLAFRRALTRALHLART